MLKKGFFCLLSLLLPFTAHASIPGVKLVAHDYFSNEDPERKAYPLKISELQVEITLNGFVAETRLDMTIYNPTDQDNLEANLSFPLPENTMINGYALDVEGVMIDGVILENKKATLAYEAIVAEQVDPGLLTLETNNRFSTRIFPVDSEQSRRISVSFVTRLQGGQGRLDYRLPFYFDHEIDQLFIKVSGNSTQHKPKFNLPKGMMLKAKTRPGGYVAEGKWKHIKPQGEIVISFPKASSVPVVVNKTNAGEYFFVIHDPLKPRSPKVTLAPENITVFWDASLSRQTAQLERELGLLRDFVQRHESGLRRLDLVVLRNARTETYSFELPSDVERLFSSLAELDYDGATDLSVIGRYLPPRSQDLYLLFTDGINSLHSERTNISHAPLFVVSSSADARVHYLDRLARSSGGVYLDLTRISDSAAKARLGVTHFELISVVVENPDSAEVYPQYPQPGDKFAHIYGRLTAKTAQVTLQYGLANKVLHTKKYRLQQRSAIAGQGLSLLWAQQKIAQLQSSYTDERAAIVATSQAYQVATDYTSLLVLEDIDQYLEHGIKPPTTMPEWIEEYEDFVAEGAEIAEISARDNFDELLNEWHKLKAWWATDIDLNSITPTIPLDTATPEDISAPFPAEAPANMSSPSVSAMAMESEGLAEEVVVSGIRASMSDAATKINIRPWSPDRPYIAALRKLPEAQWFAEYIRMRDNYGDSPAFYLDMADHFYRSGDKVRGLQILSNLLEMSSPDYTLPRVAGYKLLEYGEHDLAIHYLQIMLDQHADEPQSHRDLALALMARADATPSLALQDYARAVDLLHRVATSEWSENYAGIELIALLEMNRALAQMKRSATETSAFNPDLDARLIALLDVDLRVVIHWNAYKTDIDLWVIEPAPLGETVYYQRPASRIGGRISNDMTQGFGPEEYLLKKAIKGTYKVFVDFYGSNELIPTGAVRVKADIFVNYGRPNEVKKILMLELVETGEGKKYLVGEVEI